MKSILKNLKEAVESINWTTETKKQKALELVISIYNLYVQNGGDFYTWRTLSKEYFIQQIKTKSYLYEIKDTLIDKGIIEVNGSYDINRGKAKGYRFNESIIKGTYTALNGPTDKKVIGPHRADSIEVIGPHRATINELLNNKVAERLNNLLNNSTIFDLYHICGPKLEHTINETFKNIEINPEIEDFIDNWTLKREDIKVNEEIELDYINLIFEDDTYRYGIDKARELATKLNKDIILYKEKGYIEDLGDFITRKSTDIRLIWRKTIFDIQNGFIRVNRNTTNWRLDHNLTNIKSELIDYLTIDGEKLIELDISNAQFSILAFITDDLDNNFMEEAIGGTLYNNNKKEWFRVAFDKVKTDQDWARQLYPKTMNFIDTYKKEMGYNKLAILLQNVESYIMINGLTPYLLSKGRTFITIHDAIRVKESEVEAVKADIEEFFKSIEFKAKVRIKSGLVVKKEKINYRGIGEVEINEITKEDKRLFLDKINELKKMNIEPAESIMLDILPFEEEKTWYLYNKWLSTIKNPHL